MKTLNFNSFSNNSSFKLIATSHNGNSRYGSFNLATHVGDNRAAVLNNREAVRSYFNNKRVVIPEQIHSNIVEVVETSNIKDSFQCDGLITNSNEVVLGVLIADCVPIAIYDGEKRVFALLHAGWRGTVTEICKNAINILVDRFHSDIKDLKVAIGPAISGGCYEVGEEVYSNFRDLLQNDFHKVCRIENSKGYLDLQLTNELLLLNLGIKKENIETMRICTHCNTEYLYSYRKNGVTGRFGMFGSLYWRKTKDPLGL